MGWFKETFGAPAGSVFTKLQENEDSLTVAKGRALAYDLAHKAQETTLTFVEDEAARVHDRADDLANRIGKALRTL